jgi:hypothetical protein
LKPPVVDRTYKSYNYRYTDTGFFNIVIGDGLFVVLKRNDKLVDTIDLGYGINQIEGDRFLYHTILGEGIATHDDANSKYKKSIMASLGNYTIITNSTKELLNKLTPDFDDYYSSPSVINHRVYYWEIKKLDTTGRIKVSAAEFDPIKKTTKSHFIMDDVLETDDNGYYPMPYLKNDTIYFDAGKKILKVSKDFKLYN